MRVIARRVACLTVLVAIVGCAGCTRKAAVVEPLNVVERVWPNSPAQPRIKYLYSLQDPEDLGITMGWMKRLRAAVKGGKRKNVVSPYGIASTADGDLYVVDTYYGQVHIYDADQRGYRRFPKKKIAGFEHPLDIAVNDTGQIFISDPQGGVVHVFREKGARYVGAIGEGQLERPTGLAMHGDDLLVVDTLASQIAVFDAGTLTLKNTIGVDGKGDESFHYPVGIGVARSGMVYVTDALNFRIQILDVELGFAGNFGQVGETPGSFSRPKGVAVDSDGNVYVVDALFDNVQVFDGEGRLLLAFGSSGRRPGEFWLPTEIFIDREDRIYVSDPYNRRIQVFQYLKERQS